jgi:hypothetical protein
MIYPCYIPTLSAEHMFEYLNFEQQQTLVSGLVTGNLENGYPIKKPVIDILKANIFDKTVNIDALTIYDYLAMLYSLRVNNFSATYETRELITFDLEEMRKDLTNILVDGDVKTFSEGDFAVNYTIPSIATDLEVDRVIYEKCNPIQEKDELLKSIYKYTYIGEIVKRVKSVSYNNIQTDFEKLSMEDRFAYVGNIPVVLLRKVLNVFDQQYTDFVKYKTFQGNVLVVDYSFFI